MQVMKQHKYSLINRDELKTSVMDRSSSYRLKVEDQSLTQFHSNRTKHADFFSTLRDAKIPRSLKSSLKLPQTSRFKTLGDESMMENESVATTTEYQQKGDAPPVGAGLFKPAYSSRSKSIQYEPPMGTIVNRHSPKKASARLLAMNATSQAYR